MVGDASGMVAKGCGESGHVLPDEVDGAVRVGSRWWGDRREAR